MNCKLICILWILLGICNVFAAQAQSNSNGGPTLTQVIPPSPNAAAMQKYGDIPVSAYTGVPDISIPLYTIKYHDITVPVSLSYHASGIKVAEEATDVGLGWTLNAGGAISRNIIGYDDFASSPTTYFNTFGNLDIADGYAPTLPIQSDLSHFSLTKSGTQSTYDITTLASSPSQIEFQPDQFYYNVNGLTGKFLLRRNGQAILQNQSKLDISHNSLGTVWDIKTLDGYDYNFSAEETTTDQSHNYHMAAVYLTSITSPSGNTVTFHYVINANNYTASIGSYTESRDDGVVTEGPPPIKAPSSAGQSPGQIYNTVYLSYIDYGTGRVQFNYLTNVRTDILSDYELSSVAVYTKTSQGTLAPTPFKTFNFAYDYFSGNSFPNPAVNNGGSGSIYNQRLKLTSVTEVGTYNGQNLAANPYIFSYNTNTDMPSKTSLARDHWGYYNKQNNTTLIPTYTALTDASPFMAYWGIAGPSRNSDNTGMQAFVLTDIQYPTGGTTHFDYEANDCDEQKSYINDQSNTPYPYTIQQGKQSPKSFNWSPSSLNPQNLDVTDLFTASDVLMANNKLQVTFVFNAGINANNVTLTSGGAYLDVQDQNGNDLFKIDPASVPHTTTNNTISMTVSFGNLEIATPGIYQLVPHLDQTTYAAGITTIAANATWYTQVNSSPAATVTTPTTYSLAGGLRIQRITNSDGINPPVVKRYLYHYNIGQPNESSYGRRMSRPEYSYWEQSLDILQTTSSATDQPTNTPAVSEHLIRLADSNIPLNGSAQGMVVGYDQVTENYGENGENGKTVYQYYNNPDVVLPYTWPYPFGNTPTQLPAKRPYNSNIPDPLNGSLLEQTDYQNINGVFTPVKDVKNTYVKNAAAENVVYAVEPHTQLTTSYVDGTPSSPTYNQGNILANTYSPLQSEWTYLTSTDEKDYSNSDVTRYQEKITNYYYDNPVHYLPTRVVTTDSKGNIITSNTVYPLDCTNLTNSDPVSLSAAYLNSAHLINAPVEKYTQMSNADGSNLHTTSAILTAYNASGPPLPFQVYQWQPFAATESYTPFKTSGLIDNGYRQLPVISFDSYDQTNGNLLQQHKTGAPTDAYIWDYSAGYPIAEVKNAVQSDIAYTSFEADGTGNWTIPSTARNNGGHTGQLSYSLANGSLSKANLNASTTYIVSYWTQNSTPFTVAGTIAGYPITGATNNGWTYYEHRVTGQTTISVSGSGPIDEVRLYPQNAQISTYTYAPLIGMTSATDVKGKTTYYEYDGLQRLMNIRDQSLNIIKSYCYNYAGQSGSCYINLLTYTNDQESGSYQKQGCGSGYLGSWVTYVVPQGTYTASTLQAADNMAQADVNANGQAYANANGTCMPAATITLVNNTADDFRVDFVQGSTTYSADFSAGTLVVPVGTGFYVNIYQSSTTNDLVNISMDGQTPSNNVPRANYNAVSVASGSSTTITITNAK